MAKFILLVGLPGAGKSLYGKKLTAVEKVTKYLSSDEIRQELYGDESIQGNPNKVFGIMYQRAKEYLKNGYDVVYDATNVTRKNRKAVLDEVKNLCDEGTEAHVVWAPYFQCVERDKQRKRTVGEDVIRKFLYRWQSPYYDEGFSKVELVFNCDVGWNRLHYSNRMLDNLKIPHDNPHHALDIYEHSAAVQSYIMNKWPSSYVLEEAGSYHDLGKPMTKGYKSDESGKLIPIAHYYNHQNVGSYLAYGMYADTLECKQRAILCSWLVCNHMEPFFNSTYYKTLQPELKTLINNLHEADLAAH